VLAYRAAPHQIDDRQQDHRANERDNQRGQIEAAVVDRRATKEEAADHRADDTDNDVQERTLFHIATSCSVIRGIMQAACHDSGGTIIALCSADHESSSEQTERRESFGLFMLTV
jgi:hypothetical protein